MAAKSKKAVQAAVQSDENRIVDPETGEVIAGDLHILMASAVREEAQAAQMIEKIVAQSISRNLILVKENCRQVKAMFCGVYTHFMVARMQCDERFNWTIRMRIPSVMKNIHHRYMVVLTYNPVPALIGILNAIEQEEEEQAKPRLLGMERESEATEKKLKYFGVLQSEAQGYSRFEFEARVIAHKGCTMNDADGTELHMRVDAGDAGALNVLREELCKYSLRFEKI